MDRFDELWREATKDAATALARDGMRAEQVRDVVHLLNRINFPAALSLLGQHDGRGKVGDQLLAAAATSAAEEPALARQGVDAASAERMLKALWVHRTNPRDVLGDEAVLALLSEAAAHELAKSGVGIRPDEARQAIRLLATGEFFRDAAGTTAAVLHVVPSLPIRLGKDIRRSPSRLFGLGQAVARDLGGTAVHAPELVGDILDGELNNPPALMTHTLRWLYGMASVKSVADMIATLLAPENESLRLALVLYARANGIPLEVEHLDALRESVFRTDSPDLGPLLVVGMKELRARHGDEGVGTMLRGMAR